MLYFVDTNVLLRFVDRASPLHGVVRAAVQKLTGAGHDMRTTPQNCAEFWNVLTRPAQQNGFGLPLSVADQRLSSIELLFPVMPEVNAYARWRQLVVKYGVTGSKVHDARLAAAILQHGATQILTLNVVDFARYSPDGIVAVDPAQA